jgi:flagellar protein FlaG
MEVNSISPVRIKTERPEPLKPVAEKQQESKGTKDVRDQNTEVPRAELDNAIDQANEIGQLLNRKLNFSIDDATEKVVVKVVDEESGEVVRQVPANEMLRISAHLKQLQSMNDRVMSAVKSVILDVTY